MKVSAEAARRFLLARHFLAPARSLAGGLDGVLEVFRKLGSIQFDPTAVAESYLLKLLSISGFHPALTACAQCGALDPRMFSNSQGGAVCTVCAEPGRSTK